MGAISSAAALPGFSPASVTLRWRRYLVITSQARASSASPLRWASSTSWTQDAFRSLRLRWFTWGASHITPSPLSFSTSART